MYHEKNKRMSIKEYHILLSEINYIKCDYC